MDCVPPSVRTERAEGTKTPGEMAANTVREAVDYHRRLKARAIAYKGGRCVLCGYSRCNGALEFHHLNKSDKNFGLSKKGLIRSWVSVRRELDKCILICANCHREVEAGVRMFLGNHEEVQPSHSS